MQAAIARLPRKQPRQERSKATVAAILEGAIQVLKAGGPAALTTTRVAQRAGVSVGSLYQYFPNKESILRALKARKLESVRLAMASALEDAQILDLEGKVRALVEGLLREKARHPKLDLALSVADTLEGSKMARETTDAGRRLVESILQAHPDEVDVDDLRREAHLLVHAVTGVLDAVARQPRARFDDPALADFLVRLLVRYVRP